MKLLNKLVPSTGLFLGVVGTLILIGAAGEFFPQVRGFFGAPVSFVRSLFGRKAA